MKRIALLLSFVMLPVIAASREPQGGLRVTEAIVFKNGLAFVTQQGPLVFRDGEARIAPAPDALLGTLWAAAGERRIDAVRASKEETRTESDATSVTALLDANAGKQATLLIDDREYSGTIVTAPPALALLRVDGKVHAFERARVKSVAFADTPSLKTATTAAQSVLTLHAKGRDGAEEATLRYLRGGMSWLPDYTIDLVDDDRARVVMRATLINDGEDLQGTRVRFAVGHPNFEFASVPSPLTLQQTLQQFLASLSGSSADRFGTVMTQQLTLNYATSANAAHTPVAAPETGESAEDLFFYDREGVVLAKGERAMVPILALVAPFRHVYQWKVGSDENTTDQVWHSISVANEGTTPWTTAAALVTSGGKPLAQDTLAYTAAGSRAEVKLTVATDIAVERTEEEVERKPRDLTRAGYVYDAVIVEGTLTMRNFKRDAATLDVTKEIDGQATMRDPEGKVTRLARPPRAVNPNERLEWRITVPAGAARTVKYRYKTWVRE